MVDPVETVGPLARMWRSVYQKASEAAAAKMADLLRDHVYLFHRNLPTSGGGGGGGGWVLLYEHEVGATAELELRLPASGSIPQTHATLVLEVRARSDATGTSRDNLTLQVNATASSNYSYTLTRNDNGTVDGFASPNDSAWDIGGCPRAGAAAGHFGTAVVQLPLYARTDARKHYLAHASTGYGTGTGNLFVQTAGGWVTGTTAAVTALFLRPGFGQFATGTVVRLWGVTTE